MGSYKCFGRSLGTSPSWPGGVQGSRWPWAYMLSPSHPSCDRSALPLPLACISSSRAASTKLLCSWMSWWKEVCRAPSLSGLGSWLQGHRPAHLGLGRALGMEPWQSPGASPKPSRARLWHGHGGYCLPQRGRQPRATGAAGSRGPSARGARLGQTQAAPHSPIALGVLSDAEGEGERPRHPVLPRTRRPATASGWASAPTVTPGHAGSRPPSGRGRRRSRCVRGSGAGGTAV